MKKERISFSTGALYPLLTEDAFTLLHNAGFKNAELMPQAFSDVSDSSSLKFEKTGIHIASLHYPLAMFGLFYTSHPAMGEEGRAFGRQVVKFCKQQQTSIVVIHTTTQYKTEQMRQILEPSMLANVRYFCELCFENNIKVAMENYPTGVGQYPDTLDKYSDSFGYEMMTPMVDTTEVIEGGGDPIEFILGLKRAPSHMHLSDFKNGTKHLPLGEGDINWQGVFDALNQKGFEGYYTLEPSYKFYLTDIQNKLIKAYEAISKYVYD